VGLVVSFRPYVLSLVVQNLYDAFCLLKCLSLQTIPVSKIIPTQQLVNKEVCNTADFIKPVYGVAD